MKTGIITTDTYLNHNTGQGHPERADRVKIGRASCRERV